MEKTIINTKSVLSAFAAVGGFLAHALGGWDAALKTLLGFMVADYITGMMVAALWKRSNKSETGALDSKASFKGLCKKGVILILVCLGELLGEATGVSDVRTMLVLFFIGNEGLSLLENLSIMGVPFPPVIKNMLEVMKDKGNEKKPG